MITILPETTKKPLQKIGTMAAICWNSDTTDELKNINRANECIKSGHGRLLEFVDVEMVIEGYSARVIREWYTHIGGNPTRLQESTRYVNCENFKFYVPENLTEMQKANYSLIMNEICGHYKQLVNLGVKKEDAANILPLGMMTKIVDKRNLRNLIEMSHQRKCLRALKEFRNLFSEIEIALKLYSEEWAYIVDTFFMKKCEYLGYCPEKESCGFYRNCEIEK